MVLLLFILHHEMAWFQTVWFGYHLRGTACNKLGNRVTTHIWVAICGHIGWGCHVSNTIRIQIYVDIHHIPTKCEPLTFAAKGTSSSAVSGQLYRSSNLLAKVKRLVLEWNTHGSSNPGKTCEINQVSLRNKQTFLCTPFTCFHGIPRPQPSFYAK